MNTDSAPLVIRSSGMATSVGLDAFSTSAAIRAGVRNMSETRFVVQSDSPLIGAQIPALINWRGALKLAKLLAISVRDCVRQVRPEFRARLPLLVCVAERDRPGRPKDIERTIVADVEREIGIDFSREYSGVYSLGRVGGLTALARARHLIHERGVPRVLLAGVDSWLVGRSLAWLRDNDRLLCDDNSNGVIPGEASSCVLLDGESPRRGSLTCTGIGSGQEPVTLFSDAPFRAEGLTRAIAGALQEAGLKISDCALRLTDLSGEHYYFREAALSLSRLQREQGCDELWHPSECVGEVGAAIGPLLLGYAAIAGKKRFLPGTNAVIHVGNDAGERAAACFTLTPDPYVQ